MISLALKLGFHQEAGYVKFAIAKENIMIQSNMVCCVQNGKSTADEEFYARRKYEETV